MSLSFMHHFDNITTGLAYVTVFDFEQSFILVTAVKMIARVFICKHILANCVVCASVD